jgi:hypothetical protein
MSDVLLVAILLAFFALAIGLVHVLSRVIGGDPDPDPDRFPDEPLDTDRPADQTGWPL